MRTGALEGLYNRFIASWVDFRIGILSASAPAIVTDGPTLPSRPPCLLACARCPAACLGDACAPEHYRRHANWRIYNTLEGLLTFLFGAERGHRRRV